MTNFEKWKSDLKIDDLFSDDPRSWTERPTERPKLDCLHNCPASNSCPYANEKRECDENESRHRLSEDRRDDLRRLAKQCKTFFMEWANEEENQ